jgi:hypothetical protein
MIKKGSAWLLLAFLVALLAASTPAYALSCAPLKDFYFITCEKGACSSAFRAKQIRTENSCSRRFVVESFPEWAVDSLVPIVGKTADLNISSIYQISFWHSSGAPENATELASDITDNGDKIQVERLSTFQDHSEISALWTQWQNRADQELLWERASNAVDFGTLAVLLWILYRSASSHIQGLEAFFSRTQPLQKL